ncbi:MAG: hypothetical protein AAFX94_14865 [Myxococcota bacterium]
MPFRLEHTFDTSTYRHFINGHNAVMHCHHYMSLTTALAVQFAENGGTRVLIESAEDSMRPILSEYFVKHSVSDPTERLNLGAELYSILGLGKISVQGSFGGGEAILHRSHVDEGWVKKFGPADAPLNFFTRGFVRAIFSAAFDRPARGYAVEENESIAMGAETGRMTVRQAAP